MLIPSGPASHQALNASIRIIYCHIIRYKRIVARCKCVSIVEVIVVLFLRLITKAFEAKIKVLSTFFIFSTEWNTYTRLFTVHFLQTFCFQYVLSRNMVKGVGPFYIHGLKREKRRKNAGKTQVKLHAPLLDWH